MSQSSSPSLVQQQNARLLSQVHFQIAPRIRSKKRVGKRKAGFGKDFSLAQGVKDTEVAC